MKLTHIRLLCSNMKACVHFYRDILQFLITWGDEESNYAAFSVNSDVILSLYKRSLMSKVLKTEKLPISAMTQDQALLVFMVDDLEITTQELQSRGVKFLTLPHDEPDWGISVAHFRDPDGNVIEIHSPLNRDRWSKYLKEEAQKYE